MFPCCYSHTKAPTAVSPLIKRLHKRDKSLRGVPLGGKSGLGMGREGVRGCHGVGDGDESEEMEPV